MHTFRLTLAIGVAALLFSTGLAIAGNTRIDVAQIGDGGSPGDQRIDNNGSGGIQTLTHPDGPVTMPQTPVVSGDGGQGGNGDIAGVADSTKPLTAAPTIFCARDMSDRPGWFMIVNFSDHVIPAGTEYHYIFQPGDIEGTVVLKVDLDPNHAWETDAIIVPALASGWTCDLTPV